MHRRVIFLVGLAVLAAPAIKPCVGQTYTWNVDSDGNWNTAANWSPVGTPHNKNETAIFGNAITAPRTVMLVADTAVGQIRFENANSYGIAGQGSLTLEDDTSAGIVVAQGAHEFETVVNLNSDTDVDVRFRTALTFNDQLNLNGTVLAKTGSGRLEINSRQNIGDGTISAQRGTVAGDGTVGGDLHISGATAAPGIDVGTLTVGGDYTQDVDGTLAIEIGGLNAGSEHDQLAIAGAATLGGQLAVSLINDFLPSRGDSFSVLTFDSSSGDFDSFSGLGIGPNKRLAPVWGAKDLNLVTALLDPWKTATGVWTVGANWASGSVPGATTIAEISNGGNVHVFSAAPDVVGIDLSHGALSIELGGSLNVPADVTVGAMGTLTVDGSMSRLTAANLTLDGALNVTGMGTATVGRTFSAGRAATTTVGPGASLLVAGHLANYDSFTETLRDGQYMVRGSLRFADAHIVTNSARVVLEGESSEIANTSGVDALAGLRANTDTGDFTISNRNLNVSSGFTNAGSMTIRNGAFSAGGGYTQTAGRTLLGNGALNANTVTVQGGTLEGTGDLAATSVRNAGQVVPGFSTGNTSTGIITVHGDYTQESGGAVDIEIGGWQPPQFPGGVSIRSHDQLRVTRGTATLAGRLDLKLIDGFAPELFNPPPDRSVSIITARDVDGQFDGVLFSNPPEGWAIELDYNQDVQVRFVRPRLAEVSSSGDWSQPNTWVGATPISTSRVQMNNSTLGGREVTFDTNSNALVYAATVTGSSPMRMVIGSGTWSATHGLTVEEHGEVLVQDGILNNGGNLIVGGDLNASGNPTVTQRGGTVNVAGNLNLGGNGGTAIYNLGGGKLDMHGGDINLSDTAAFNFNEGTLQDAATITGNLVQNGGTLAPGKGVGTTKIQGDYTITAGTLQIDVGGTEPGEFDTLVVDNTATLGGTLDIRLTENLNLSVGDELQILQAAGGIIGTFDTIHVPRLNDVVLVTNIRDFGLVTSSVMAIGDMNRIPPVDQCDVDAFVFALTDPVGYNTQFGLNPDGVGDFNADGRLDVDDIPAFAEKVLNKPCESAILSVPEPSSLALIHFMTMALTGYAWHKSRRGRDALTNDVTLVSEQLRDLYLVPGQGRGDAIYMQ